MSGQSNLSWDKYTWLGPGHTIPCDSWQSSDFEFALLVREHDQAPHLSLGTQFSDHVSVVWFLPISAAERETAMEESSEYVEQTLPRKRWQEA